MYKIKITTFFSAAHFLREYKGKCENLHGHNWKVEISVSRSSLDSLGMVMDFGDLKILVNNMLDGLDHKNLNDLECFSAKGGSASEGEGLNPSSENIAKYIFDRLKEDITKKKCKLEKIKVWETPNSCAVYHE